MAFPFLPGFEINWNTHREVADNVYNAQMAGAPKVLTYNGADPRMHRKTRAKAMTWNDGKKSGEVPQTDNVTDRDEYPFACTAEGGERSWIGHVISNENQHSGSLLGVLLKGKPAGYVFRVIVINHPKGLVTNRCRKPCAACMPVCAFPPPNKP